MALAKSLLIKSELVAVETEYMVSTYLDKSDEGRRGWKYFLNLSGQYHSLDTPMVTRSLDTLETIDFTKDVINQHPITKANLLQFGQDFKKLVNAYPDQIGLIYGILYQPNIDTVIQADELEIIAYNESLVETQEIELISDLQQRIRRCGLQIADLDWNDIERAYSIGYLTRIALQVPYFIKAIRYSKQLTAQAHSFFIWNHINSYVYLEDLKSLFSNKEVMFLYKNIDRLFASSGGREVLTELLSRFVTTRNIKAFNLRVRRNANEVEVGRGQLLEFVNTGLNIEESQPLSEEAVYNQHLNRSLIQLDDYEGDVYRKMLHSLDTAQSREIMLVDEGTVTPLPRLTLTAVDLSFQLASYNTLFYTIINHIENVTYSLSYAECCVLYMRLVQMRTDTLTETIPVFSTHSVPKTELPTATQLVEWYDIPQSYADSLVANAPIVPTSINDVDAQRQYRVYVEHWEPWFTRQLVELTTLESSAYIHRIAQEFLEIKGIDLTGRGVNYQDWLQARGVDLNTLDKVDIQIIENRILEDVFGLDVGESVTSTVNQLSELLSRFSAYHVNINPAASGSMNLPNGILPILAGKVHLPINKALTLLLANQYSSVDVSPVTNVKGQPIYCTQGTLTGKGPLELSSPLNDTVYEPISFVPSSTLIINY